MLSAPIRDVHLGRLALPTVLSPVTEQLGSPVASVGEMTAVGQRKAKGFTLTFPLHGTPGDTDLFLAGNRQRRQLRSLMQNPAYRLAGVYLDYLIDPERNAWIVIGEGELADDDGGVPFGEYRLTLSQAFVTASVRTHRDAYRVDNNDLRAATALVDYLGQQVGIATGFASIPALALSVLPAGARDIAARDTPLPSGSRSGKGGAMPVLVARATGEIVSWERDESDFNKGDVIAYDRRGRQTPAVWKPYVQAIRAQAPISWWRLDEVSGAGAADQQAANPLAYRDVSYGEPGATSDSDQAVRLHGPSSLMQTMWSETLGPPVLTLMMAVKPSGSDGQLMHKTDELGDVSYDWNLLDGKQTFTVGGNVGTSETALPLNVWSWLAVTWDGGFIRFYLNGQPDGVQRRVSGSSRLRAAAAI